MSSRLCNELEAYASNSLQSLEDIHHVFRDGCIPLSIILCENYLYFSRNLEVFNGNFYVLSIVSMIINNT